MKYTKKKKWPRVIKGVGFVGFALSIVFLAAMAVIAAVEVVPTSNMLVEGAHVTTARYVFGWAAPWVVVGVILSVISAGLIVIGAVCGRRTYK